MGNSEYQFEEFCSFKGKFSSKISVVKTGGFGFSAGFFNKNNLVGSSGIKIYFDKSKFAVAFKVLKNNEEGMIKIKGKGEKGAYIPARSFLGKYNIDPIKYSGKYDPKEILDENLGRIFVIDLKEKQYKD